MKLADFQWNPTPRQLRQFGAVSVVMLPLLAWLWHGHPSVILGLAGAGLLMALLSWVWPPVIKPLFIGLMLIAFPVGMVIGELVLLVIYFGVFLPIAVVFRLQGRDTLLLKRDASRSSYWQRRKRPQDPARYYLQS